MSLARCCCALDSDQATRTLRIGLCCDVAPAVDSRGGPSGFFVDLWQAWSEKNGQPIRFSFYESQSKANTALGDGEIDVVGNIEIQNLNDEFLWSRPLGTLKRLAVSQHPFEIGNFANLENRQIVVHPSLSRDIESIRSYLPKVAIEISSERPTNRESVWIVPELLHGPTHALGFPEQSRHQKPLFSRLVFFCVGKGERELLERLETGWAYVTAAERWAIESSWVPVDKGQRLLDQSHRLEFSKSEIQFLIKHPIVKLGASRWEPLTVVEDGRYSGIAIDLCEQHLNCLGVTPIFVGHNDWMEVRGWFDNKEIDGLGFIVPNEERRQKDSVSEPYVFAPLVVVTEENGRIDENPQSFSGMTFGIIEDYGIGEIFSAQHPGIKIIQFAERDRIARSLAKGEIDAWLEIAPVAQNVLAEQGIDNCRIAHRTDLFDGMALLLQKELGLLNEMFDRVVVNSSSRDMSYVYQKWNAEFQPQNPGGYLWALWLAIGTGSLAFLLGLVVIKSLRTIRNSRRTLELSEQSLRRAQLLSRSGSLEIFPDLERIRFSGETFRLFNEQDAFLEETINQHASRFDASSSKKWREAIGQIDTMQSKVQIDLSLKNGNIFRYIIQKWSDHGNMRITATVQDISESARQEAESQALQQRVNQLQKLDALGNLAGGIAHDFNNILTASIGYNELAIESIPQNHGSRKWMDEVLNSSLRARDLVKQILAFSRNEDESSERIQLGKVVEETRMLVESSLPSNVKLNFLKSGYDEKAWLMGDSVKLMQVLINLCSNAFQAMPDGGTLSVRVLSDDQHSILEVQDDGVGMTPATLSRIFEPFFTTRPVGKGTGMGLSIVHGIVRSMEGKIETDSQIGLGTTLRVFFPISKGGESKKQTTPSQLGPSVSKQKILVVDDEPAVLDVIQKLLKNLGYQPEGFLKAGAALTAFKNTPNEYALVVTDLTMPEISGFELITSIRGIRDDIPVIVCSGYDLENEFESNQKLRESILFLKKPFSFQSLNSAINDSLSQMIC